MPACGRAHTVGNCEPSRPRQRPSLQRPGKRSALMPQLSQQGTNCHDQPLLFGNEHHDPAFAEPGCSKYRRTCLSAGHPESPWKLVVPEQRPRPPRPRRAGLLPCEIKKTEACTVSFLAIEHNPPCVSQQFRPPLDRADRRKIDEQSRPAEFGHSAGFSDNSGSLNERRNI
jgi:hypothetical protein